MIRVEPLTNLCSVCAMIADKGYVSVNKINHFRLVVILFLVANTQLPNVALFNDRDTFHGQADA